MTGRRPIPRWRIAAGVGVLGCVVLAGIGWAAAHDSSPGRARSRQASATRPPAKLATPPPTSPPSSPPSTTSTTPPTTASSPPPAPPPGAPYAVGVVKVTLVDPSRPSPARGDRPALTDRELPVTIYYPAGGAPVSGDASDAAALPGTFPLVVFAHGFDVSASTYAGLEHELAAGGLIVAAPDFPTSSSAFPGPPAETDIVNQAHDVSFLITVLDSGAGLPAVLSGHVAPTKAGVVGQSDGGTTVAEAVGNSCCADARIGAAAVLSGDEGHDGGQWFASGGPPLLVVQGTADDINPPALSEKLFADATAPKFYVAITDGAHLEPYTSGPQLDAISKLLVDFLRAELETDRPFAQVLADANDPGVLSLSASVP